MKVKVIQMILIGSIYQRCVQTIMRVGHLGKKHLAHLILSFHRIKTRFSPDQRRSLRRHFLSFAQQCVRLNDFKSAAIIAENLADHAYKFRDRDYTS